jgi:hypothetical protein
MSQVKNLHKYKIQRWDAVMFNNSIAKVPVIYIKPDNLFLKFAKNNKYIVMATVEGTDMIYDGKQIPGVIDQSGNIPNCRPNYFSKTGYYVVSLWSLWYGYPHPSKLGYVSFSGLNEVTVDEMKDHPEEIEEKEVVIPISKKDLKLSDNKKGMDIKHIIAMAMILVILLAIITVYNRS